MIKNKQRYMREKYTKRGNRGKEERAKVRQIKYERENERKARVIEIEQYQILWYKEERVHEAEKSEWERERVRERKTNKNPKCIVRKERKWDK